MNISDRITLIDYSVVAVYLLIVFGYGMSVSYRRRKSQDLFLGGRSLSWFPIGMSIFSTNVSPSFLVATFGLSYSIGMVGANFEWLAWMFLFLLAMLFAPHYLRTNITTMPEFLGMRYSPGCRTFLSWYALFTTLCLWIGGTLYTGGLILSQILGWHVLLCVVILCLISMIIAVSGGLVTIALTDQFQTAVMIIASAWMTFVGLYKVGGVEKLIDSVPADFWVLLRPASDKDYPWHAILLGYPVLGIWFWCTDQTIVQRVLGAKNIVQGQAGCAWAAYLKILTPLIFFIPGIMCRILNPDIQNTNQAYLTMVTRNMPVGAIGIIVAIMLSALIGTTSSGLNSFSTLFTNDIYSKFSKSHTLGVKSIGRIMMVIAALLSIIVAMGFNYVSRYMDLFSMFQSMLGFFAPSMSAVFLIGILWSGATPRAGFLTLVIGTAVSISMGVFYLFIFPKAAWWPHFLMLSFYLFAACCCFEIVVSLFTTPLPKDKQLEQVSLSYFKQTSNKWIWAIWAFICLIMIGIYLLFNRVFW